MNIPKGSRAAVVFLVIGAFAGSGLTILAHSTGRDAANARWQAAAEAYVTTRRLSTSVSEYCPELDPKAREWIELQGTACELALVGWRHALSCGENPSEHIRDYRNAMYALTARACEPHED